MDELQIDYPCRWQFKLIGRDEAELRAAVATVLAGQAHELELSNTSAAGRYVSLTLELEVHGAEHRQGVWDLLAALEAVVFMI